MKSFLFANVPLSVLHFILFVIFIYSVRNLQGFPRTAGVHCGRRHWRVVRRRSLVGGHGDQLARLGRGAVALCLPVHPQDPQVELIKQAP